MSSFFFFPTGLLTHKRIETDRNVNSRQQKFFHLLNRIGTGSFFFFIHSENAKVSFELFRVFLIFKYELELDSHTYNVKSKRKKASKIVCDLINLNGLKKKR